MRLYSHGGLVGCASLKVSRYTGTMVGVYNVQQADFGVHEPWVAVCEPHGSMIGAHTLKDARSAAVDPRDWCPRCDP